MAVFCLETKILLPQSLTRHKQEKPQVQATRECTYCAHVNYQVLNMEPFNMLTINMLTC